MKRNFESKSLKNVIGNIIDNSTWENPHQYPSGIDWVIVNGNISLENGTPSKNLYGKVLTHHE